MIKKCCYDFTSPHLEQYGQNNFPYSARKNCIIKVGLFISFKVKTCSNRQISQVITAYMKTP